MTACCLSAATSAPGKARSHCEQMWRVRLAVKKWAIVQLLPCYLWKQHKEQGPNLHVRQQEVAQGARGARARRQRGARVIHHGHHRRRAPGCARAGAPSLVRRLLSRRSSACAAAQHRAWPDAAKGKAWVVSLRREAWRARSFNCLFESPTAGTCGRTRTVMRVPSVRQGAAGKPHRRRTAAQRPRPRPPAAAARPARPRPWPRACSPGSRTPAAGHELSLATSLIPGVSWHTRHKGRSFQTMDDCRPTRSHATPRHA
jgi:hypothetical protein